MAGAENALGMGELILEGRIERYIPVGDDGHAVVMTLPAPSTFDKPSSVQVRVETSRLKVGMVEKLRARVIGWERKAYERTDKRTGRVEWVKPCDVALVALDA